MTTTESVQSHVDQLIARVEVDLDHRGILYINRAQTLLSAVKRAQREMEVCEQTTPADFFNPKWRQQANSLGQLHTRLTRIIKGVRVPIDEHEATVQ
jgi:hypothetical protein